MQEVKIFTIEEKIFTDHRGMVFFPLQDGFPPISACDPATIHLVRTEPGQVRGNHFHPRCAEWLYSFGGPAELFWMLDGRLKSVILDREDQWASIPPGLPHAVRNIGSGPHYLLAFREKSPAPPHTVACKII